MEILGALIAGGAIGAVLGFVGAGGAMLSVPILMYGFGFDAKSATTAALAVVLLAALSGAIPKARKGQILYRDALVIVGLGLVTNLGFASIVEDLSNSFISTGFAAMLILAGLSMLRTPKFSEQTRMPFSVRDVARDWIHHWALWNRWRLLSDSSSCSLLWNASCNRCRYIALDHCAQLVYFILGPSRALGNG